MAISCRRRAAGATRGVHYHRASGTLVSCTMTTSATSPARESRDSVVIRFAGDSDDGMQVTGGRFTVETALAGNDLTTFPDYPAEIRAPAGTTYGVSAFQIHFGAVDVMTPGDQVDVLVAMNPAALKVDLKDLRVGGTVVVDLGAFTERNLAKAGFKTNPLEDGSLAQYQVLKLDVTKLTLDAGLGAAAHARRPGTVRRDHLSGRGRDLGHRGRRRSGVRRGAGRDVDLGPRHGAQDRDAGPRDRDRAAARGRQLPAGRSLDRHAHEGGAIGSAAGSPRAERGRAARGVGRGHRDRLLRRRDRGSPPRDEVHDPGDPALRRVPRPRRRAVAHSRPGSFAALSGPLPDRARRIPSLPPGSGDAGARVGAPRHAGARAPHRRTREGLRHGSHLL